MTDEQLESMFIAISKSITLLGDRVDAKLSLVENRLSSVENRLSALEVGQETIQGDIKGLSEGVSLLLERREVDELWRAEMEARVLKLEADVHDIKKRLLSA